MEFKNIINRYTVLGILLILSSVFARADFTLGSDYLEGDCFIPILEEYEFQNNTSTTNSYNLTAKGEASAWINANGKFISKDPLAFSLEPSKTEEIFTFTKPFCTVFPGVYTMTLFSTPASSGVSTSKLITFNVLPSRTLSITPDKTTKETEECTETSFDFEIRNKSKADEIIEFQVFGLPNNWYTISDTEFLLEKGAQKDTVLTILPECNAKPGDYDFNALARLKGTEFFVFEPMTFTIEDSQTITLGTNTQRDIDVCSEKGEKKTLTVTNNGKMADIIELSIDSTLASVTPAILNLPGNSTQTIDITINTNPTLANQTRDVTLTAVSQTFEKTFTQKISITYSDCFDLEDDDKNASKEIPTVCNEDKFHTTFNLENTGKQLLTGNAKLQGLKGTVNPLNYSIKPGDIQGFEIDADVTGLNQEKFRYSFVAESDGFVFTKELLVNIENCYALDLNADMLTQKNLHQVKANEELAFILEVANIGTKFQDATIDLFGPTWIYYQPTELELEAGEKKEFYIYVSPAIDSKDVNAKLTVKVTGNDYSGVAVSEFEVVSVLDKKLEELNLETTGSTKDTSTKSEKLVTVTFTIFNPLKQQINVEDLEVLGYGTTFDRYAFGIDSNAQATVTATVNLGEHFDAPTIDLPVRIYTSEGLIDKTITVAVPKESEENITTPTGFFNLADNNTILILLLFAVIIALFAYIGRSSGKKKEEKQSKPKDKKKPKQEPKVLSKA